MLIRCLKTSIREDLMKFYSKIIISNRQGIVNPSLNKLICHQETQRSMKLRVLAMANQWLIHLDQKSQYSQLWHLEFCCRKRSISIILSPILNHSPQPLTFTALPLTLFWIITQPQLLWETRYTNTGLVTTLQLVSLQNLQKKSWITRLFVIPSLSFLKSSFPLTSLKKTRKMSHLWSSSSNQLNLQYQSRANYRVHRWSNHSLFNIKTRWLSRNFSTLAPFKALNSIYSSKSSS